MWQRIVLIGASHLTSACNHLSDTADIRRATFSAQSARECFGWLPIRGQVYFPHPAREPAALSMRIGLTVLFLLAAAPVVTGQTPRRVTFERDVQPILTRFGCNAGACHGKARGQNGF